jgi:hypothetical protein
MFVVNEIIVTVEKCVCYEEVASTGGTKKIQKLCKTALFSAFIF